LHICADAHRDAGPDHCVADTYRAACHANESTANRYANGCGDSHPNRHGYDRAASYTDTLGANRHTNHRTADTHCVVCYSYKPTANHDGATGGESWNGYESG
jgi:hypothetical protein